MATVEALRSSLELGFKVMMDVDTQAAKSADTHAGFAVNPHGFAIGFDLVAALHLSNSHPH